MNEGVEDFMKKVGDKEAFKKLVKIVGIAAAMYIAMSLPEKFGMNPTGDNVPQEQLQDIKGF